MKIRVLILEQQSYWGGAQRVLQTVLDGLHDQIEPLVALPEPGAFGFDLQKQGIETLIYPLGKYQSGRKSLTDMLAFGPRSLFCAVLLARLILKRRIQLVYINGPRCLPAGVIAARLTGKPSLFSLHNILGCQADVILASRGAACASRIVACSKAAAAPLLKANPSLASKLQVLYPPADNHPPVSRCDVPRPQRKTPEFVIGMVSRITGAKGHHVLLEALARLKSRGERKTVLLGAPAPGSAQDLQYLSSLRRWATEQGLDGSVHWAGFQADPHPYYETLDVLVVPSVGEEGIGLVILEAFQRGVPVVASRTGGTPELIKDGINGLLVRPGNPEELARALERLQFEPGLRARLAAQACASIDRRFSRELYCSTLSSLISELCVQPAPTGAVLTEPSAEGEVAWAKPRALEARND